MKKVVLTKENKPAILAALYNASFVQGLGKLQAMDGEMTTREAENLLSECSYFDYLHGKVMKLDFNKEELWFGLYDRDNGEGAGVQALENAGLI